MNTPATSLVRLRVGDKGSMSVFVAAFVLPFLFFLFSLSVDLSKYYTETQRAQKAADDAALYAYRFLPYSDQAATAARNYLSSFGALAERADIITDSKSVSVKINATSTLSFARFFGVEAGIPMSAFATVWGSPLDVFIAVDSSALVAPAVPGGGVWDAENWPAADLFSGAVPGDPFYQLSDPQALTQRCFNPVFSALKRTAIWTYDYLAGFEHNTVGAGFYPGALGSLDILRMVLPAGDRKQGSGEADFTTIQSAHSYGRHEWCAAAALAETSHEDYRFQAAATHYPKFWNPDSQGIAMLNEAYSFNPDFAPFVQTREVIWSRAASEAEITNMSGPSFSGVLRAASGYVFAASGYQPDVEDENPDVSGWRGALIGRARKSLVVLAGDVPWENGQRYPSSVVTDGMLDEFSWLREQISRWKTNLKILYVFFRHPGNNSTDLDQRVAALQEFFETQSYDLGQSNPSKFEAKVVFAESAEDLQRKIPALLLLERKSAMLAR